LGRVAVHVDKAEAAGTDVWYLVRGASFRGTFLTVGMVLLSTARRKIAALLFRLRIPEKQP